MKKYNDWRRIYESECGKWRVTGNGWMANVHELPYDGPHVLAYKHLTATELDNWMAERSAEGTTWRVAPGALMHFPRDLLSNRAIPRSLYTHVSESVCGIFNLYKNRKGFKVTKLCYIGTPHQVPNARTFPTEAKLNQYVEENGIVWK